MVIPILCRKIKHDRASNSDQYETVVSSTKTYNATQDPESHRIDRDSFGYIYTSFKDKKGYVYVAKSPFPNSIHGIWTIAKLFGGSNALLGNLLVANFGASIKIDRTKNELSFVMCEKTNHYCIYTRCKLTASGGISNANNWYKEGTQNPTTQGYQQIGTIGKHTTIQLSVVEHDGKGKAMIAYGETTNGVFHLKYVWYDTSWTTPITISSYSNYEWAPDLVWTDNDVCHIAWESYQSNTIRYKRCEGVANSMTASNWKKANGETGYDNAVFHSTLKPRAFSMISNSNHDIFFTSHTELDCGDAGERSLYNILDRHGSWKFVAGECGTVAITGKKTWSYPNLGIKNNETPIVVYSKIYGNEKLYYRMFDGSTWTDEAQITSMVGRFPIIERRQPTSQTGMIVLFTKYASPYPVIAVTLEN